MERRERLMAYVDNELPPAERAAFERDLAADPGLQEEVSRQQALRRRLSAAFDPVLEEPVPLRLTLAAQAANAPGRSWRAPQWAAMAACLALGVLVGRTALPEHGPLVARDGALVARGPLAKALDQRLAAEGGAVRVGLSFRSTDGRYCRTFQSAPDRLAGLACREPQGWTARAFAAWSPPADAAYRTAGSETPAPVLAAVDGLIAGAPLDAAAERAARDGGWKP
ncbi:zf-HC2 domain-containing protein [Phenylobacterium sp. LjRoot225]|uniref:anti-sigma factor family protein n=1 Tax=Phenylobacterium sp. LjRoot225 TaxID=3342285 RepID=UPI003ED041AE